MSRFGPTRGELRFRLAVSLAGLALVGATVALRGIPNGPALVEVIGIAGLFFGGSAVWAARQLVRRRGPAGPETDPSPEEEAAGAPRPPG